MDKHIAFHIQKHLITLYLCQFYLSVIFSVNFDMSQNTKKHIFYFTGIFNHDISSLPASPSSSQYSTCGSEIDEDLNAYSNKTNISKNRSVKRAFYGSKIPNSLFCDFKHCNETLPLDRFVFLN